MKTKGKRILILSGGNISIPFVKEYLKKESFDFIIAADFGLVAVEELNLQVNYIVGDFDSTPKELLAKYKEGEGNNSSYTMKEYNPIKDYTDTQIAIESAIKLMPEEIIILGGTGTRIDHMLSNIQNLLLPLNNKIQAFIIDKYNKIYLIDKNTTIRKENLFGPFISLLPYTPVVEEVTLTGFKYPLDKHNINIGNSLGISNQVIESKARILLKSGILIVIESRDE
jgi:thiamine pyrophosphokinase